MPPHCAMFAHAKRTFTRLDCRLNSSIYARADVMQLTVHRHRVPPHPKQWNMQSTIRTAGI
eukprot:6615357-Alexandrium_andersonii.AAC.1